VAQISAPWGMAIRVKRASPSSSFFFSFHLRYPPVAAGLAPPRNRIAGGLLLLVREPVNFHSFFLSRETHRFSLIDTSLKFPHGPPEDLLEYRFPPFCPLFPFSLRRHLDLYQKKCAHTRMTHRSFYLRPPNGLFNSSTYPPELPFLYSSFAPRPAAGAVRFSYLLPTFFLPMPLDQTCFLFPFLTAFIKDFFVSPVMRSARFPSHRLIFFSPDGNDSR